MDDHYHEVVKENQVRQELIVELTKQIKEAADRIGTQKKTIERYQKAESATAHKIKDIEEREKKITNMDVSLWYEKLRVSDYQETLRLIFKSPKPTEFIGGASKVYTGGGS